MTVCRTKRFKEIYMKYGTCVLKYIYARLNYSHIQDAEDIHQEVFLALFQNDKVMASNEEYIKAWLLTVSKYKTINFLKKYSTSHEVLVLDDLLINVLENPYGNKIDDLVEGYVLLPYIRKLKWLERRLIYARLLGRSFDDIAIEENKSKQALKSRYYRGLKKLRKDLKRDGIYV